MNGLRRGISILGSTGSIGTQSLEVVRMFRDRLQVKALSAGSNFELLAKQALEFQPECVVIGDDSGRNRLEELLAGTGIRILVGAEGLVEAATLPSVDTVLTALVGFVGLESAYAAVSEGKKVALANKETLVVGGELVMARAAVRGAEVIPVDSEHSAIFQCLMGESAKSVETLILTASGGPFRTRPVETFADITREEALCHPNWSMGEKITVDSASMMNKGLEIIEAYWLFGIEPERIQVLIHPQSIIHSMVTFCDGSTKAQLGVPDMKLPIQHALSYPERWSNDYQRIDWANLRCLDFEQPDMEKFPCLRLAYDALAAGGTAPAILNAANEEAVALFLKEQIRFVDIPSLIEAALERIPISHQITLEALTESDRAARRMVKELLHTAIN